MGLSQLGESNLHVSSLCFGSNVLGWTVDEKLGFKILDAITEKAGCNFIDTADVYSNWVPGHQGGESETVLGKWMKSRGNRSKLIIATKVGFKMAPDKGGLSKSHIFTSVDDSLKRLQTDYIDLYQAHTDDLDTPLEETLFAFNELIKQGKVKAIGASNYNAERLQTALTVSEKCGYARYESLQPLYNLYDRKEYEQELEPLCVSHGLGVITYYSLAAGFLTGKYRSQEDLKNKARGNTVQKYLNDRGLKILKALDQLAQEYAIKPATLALAWVMARPSITAPIVSATDLQQVNDLASAIQFQLPTSALEMLDQASAW